MGGRKSRVPMRHTLKRGSVRVFYGRLKAQIDIYSASQYFRVACLLYVKVVKSGSASERRLVYIARRYGWRHCGVQCKTAVERRINGGLVPLYGVLTPLNLQRDLLCFFRAHGGEVDLLWQSSAGGPLIT